MFSGYTEENNYGSFRTTQNKPSNIVIEPNEDNQYYALMGESTPPIVGEDDSPEPKQKKCKNKQSMGIMTNLYIGSLSIVGLFIMYKLLAKQR